MPDTTVDAQRAALRGWLSRHAPGESVTFAETHISIVAFGTERAWKLKKAVAFSFIDLSTRDLRRSQCEREVRLNRRLAPDVYLGVVPLDDESGQVLDHLVEMRRLPDESRLAALVASGVDCHQCLDLVADLIARFHAESPRDRAIDASATREAASGLWEANLADLVPHAATIVDGGDLDRVALLARSYLAGRGRLFDERIAAGRVRDGHGDLLADDIFCIADGPRVLDCLEFDDQLRYGDALADVAFLAMDLERLGRSDLARYFLDRYRDLAADDWPESLEHLYVAYRAVVRAKVACLRAVAGVRGAAERARRLLTLSRDHLEAGRVRLVLIGGPPASGKTTLANAVAGRFGWPVLHSDEVRKDLAGIEATTHERSALDTGIYTPEWHARTYGALCDRARNDLERGFSVVLDASWSNPQHRLEAVRIAAETSSELVAFRCRVPRDVLVARAAARETVGTDASDATSEIAEHLDARFAPWPDAIVVDASASAASVASWTIDVLETGR